MDVKRLSLLLIALMICHLITAQLEVGNVGEEGVNFDYTLPNINYINSTLNGSYWTTSTDQSGLTGTKDGSYILTTTGPGTFGDLEVYGYNGDTTRSLDWYPTSSTYNYLEVGDALRLGLINGVTIIEGMDGASDSVVLRGHGTGALYFNYQDGTGGVRFYNGASTQVGQVGSNGAVSFGTSDSTGINYFYGKSYPVVLTSRYTTTTNSLASGMNLRTVTSGDMVDGFGGGFTFAIRDNADVTNEIGGIYGIRDGADNSGAIGIYNYNSGSASVKWKFRANGDLEAQDSYDITTTGNISAGGLLVQPISNGRDTFEVRNSSGHSILLSVDTDSERVGFGLSNPSFAYHFKPQRSAVNTAPVFFIQSEDSGLDSTIGFADDTTPDWRIGIDNGVGMTNFMISRINNDYAFKIDSNNNSYTKNNMTVGEDLTVYGRERINDSESASGNVDLIKGTLTHSSTIDSDGTYFSRGIHMIHNTSNSIDVGAEETINCNVRGVDVEVNVSDDLTVSEGTLSYSAIGGRFDVLFGGSGTDITQNIYGVKGNSQGDMDTGSTTKHYGGYFSAQDDAGNNYGVYGYAKDSENSHGVYGYATGDNTNSYGGYFKSVQGEEGSSYGIYVTATGGTQQYGIWLEDGDLILGDDSQEIILGEGQDASIDYDGSNLIFTTNKTGNGIAWFSSNVSAPDFIDRTSIYDKERGNSLDWAKDTNDLVTDSNIDHSKFYGYTTYLVTDFSRPEINKTSNEIYYPYKIEEEGVSISQELALLRQQIYDLKTENDLIKQELCLKDISYSWCRE